MNKIKNNEKKESVRSVFNKLLKLWFSTDNAPKWCCYYDLECNQSIWYFSDELWLMHYDGDLWVPITYKEVLSLIK